MYPHILRACYQGLGRLRANRLGEAASRIPEPVNGLYLSLDLSDSWAPNVRHQLCTDGLGTNTVTVPGWSLLILAQFPFCELSKVAVLPPSVTLPAHSAACWPAHWSVKGSLLWPEKVRKGNVGRKLRGLQSRDPQPKPLGWNLLENYSIGCQEMPK